MTIWGSEISGMASSDAERIATTLNATAAATSNHTTARHRITARMTARIISSAFGSFLQLLFSIDEEAAEGHDRLAVVHAAGDLGVELALPADLDFPRRVLPRSLLHVDNVLLAFLDDGFVGHGEKRSLLDDDLHHVERRVRAAGRRERRVDHDVLAPRPMRRHPRDECLIHRRLRARRKGADALADFHIRRV